MVRAFHYADFDIPLRPNSRYPIGKFRMLVDRVREQGLFASVSPGARGSDDVILLAHDPAYLDSIRQGNITERAMREMGFPWSPQLALRAFHIIGSTLDAADAARRDGVAVVLGGGAHHSFADRGRGFCVFNDIATTILSSFERGEARRASVIDCDVHQGDGTASILGSYSDVFTFSVHGESNYPFQKERSSLDIGLPDGAGDAQYLAAVTVGLDHALRHEPDLVVFVAGADPFAADRLGRLQVTADGLEHRDRMVLGACRDAEIPCVVVMGGGYCDPIDSTVDLNVQTCRVACEIFE